MKTWRKEIKIDRCSSIALCIDECVRLGKV